MTAARCPTCDREECDSLKMPGWAPYECACGGFDCPLCRAAQDCERHAVDWRARALAAETDAAKWAKVAPLIERLRHTRRHAKPGFVVKALDNLLAATEDAP